MGARVLVVDDARFMRQMLKSILTSAGFEVVAEGSDGFEAIDLYRVYQPSLVFLDITMPNLSGLEALKELTRIYPKTKVIMCSAMGQECMVREAFALGAKDSRVLAFEHQNRNVLNLTLAN